MTMELDRQAIAEDVFRATGMKVSSSDPAVTAALYYSHKVREAGDAAAASIQEAVAVQQAAFEESCVRIQAGIEKHQASLEEVALAATNAGAAYKSALDEAKLVVRRSAAERESLADSIEARLSKRVGTMSQGQATQDGQSVVTLRQAALAMSAALVLGAILFALGTAAVCGYSFSWMNDASVGREFLRTLPTMDPDLRNKLVHHLEHPLK